MKNPATPPAADPTPGPPDIYSVGYSTQTLEEFIALLRGAGVRVLADVRSFASSRYMPAYNRAELEPALRAAGIEYVFLGDDLGGRPAPEELYGDNGRVNYEETRKRDFFCRGLDRLFALGRRARVAMMCGEEDPLDCHRGLMITPALVERGVAPVHLRRGGDTETTAEFEDRLLRETKTELPLFADDPDVRRELLEHAYRHRAKSKAFKLPKDAAE